MNSEENKKTFIRKIPLVFLIICLVTYVIGFVLMPLIKDNKGEDGNHNDRSDTGYYQGLTKQEYCYKEGVKELEKGNYLEAIKFYSDAGEISQLLSVSGETIDLNKSKNEAFFKYAESLFNRKDFLMANVYYELAGDTENTVEQIKLSKYMYAKDAYNKKQYLTAYKVFSGLPSDYKSCGAEANQSKYMLAGKVFNEKNYKSAYTYYSQLPVTYKDTKTKMIEAKYLYAYEIYKKKDYKEAMNLYGSADLKNYKKSADFYKSSIYNYGIMNYNSKAYTIAVVYLKQVKGYKSADKYCNYARYEYVKAHKNNTDQTTYEYLKELKAANFMNSRELYNSLYAWKVTNVYFNTSEDSTIKREWISRYDPVYCHFDLEGGPPNGSTFVHYKITYPNGGTRRSKQDEKWSDGWSGWSGWESGLYEYPYYGDIGDLTFTFYDDSNNVIGSASVFISYDTTY